MKNYSQLFAFLFILLAFSCTKPPDYPDEPVIEFLSLSRSTIPQGTNLNDTIWITIGFTDGDGDIGLEETTDKQLTIIDTHFNSITEDNIMQVSVPFVPEQGAGNGISGTISVATFTNCCVHPVQGAAPCSVIPGYPTDSLVYEIFMTDRAGNESNHIFTEPIILLCE